MKRNRVCKGVLVVFALLMVVLIAPGSARADFDYSFTGTDGFTSAPYTFSITAPSLFTTTGSFSTSVTLLSTTFTNGYFDASNDCFAFSTSALSSCNYQAGTDSFFGVFPGATADGTYPWNGSGCWTNAAGTQPCDDMMSLTITGSAATPEPSGLMLLGSGVLGIAGVLRRRLRC
jgi:hypothetical protein